jgi:subtilisin family serine protease
MSGYRRAISAGAATSVAMLALLAIASAPAASGRLAQARPFLTDAAHHIRVLDRPRQAASWRTRGLEKLDLRLAGLVSAREPGAAVTTAAHGLMTTRDGRLRVVVESPRPASIAPLAERLGGRVERVVGTLVQVAVPRAALASLARQPAVGRVRAPFARVEHAVTGEGVAATSAAAWHEKGLTGKGVKIAVIDGGFQGLAERQAAGDLPANAITADFCGGEHATASDHGTAVAEIVHEMAPDAQLYLLCIDTEVDLAAAVRFAKSNGVQIVNHSIGWAGPWRGDGSGPIGAIVADARASGILWINSAGNEAETHWSGTYTPSGNLHAWDPSGDIGNSFVWPNGSEICGFLRWDEWPAGISDFDLGLFLSGANVLIDASEDEQAGSEPPFEALCMYQETGADLVVFWAIRGWSVTTSPRLDLVTWSPPLEYRTAAGSIGDPATSRAALAVGALCWQTKELESFSSQGPTIDGRPKPEIVGHDSVSGATYGPFTGCPSGFAGTSASAPEVAGAAALVEQAYPAYGPDQLQQFLVRNAADHGVPGIDNATGAGELRLSKPPDLAAPTARALVSTGRLGKAVKLVSTVADDSGEARLVATVKRNGRMVATLERGFVSISGSARLSLTWKAPKTARGAYQHCVRASDRANNTSPRSCAKLVLR